MNAITKDLPASFFDYQPGDATRYTVMYCRVSVANAYVAIGDGDVTRMGYVVPLGNLFHDVKEVAEQIRNTQYLMEQEFDNPDDAELVGPITSKVFEEMNIVQYWMGHFHHLDHKPSQVWTATVALLFAAVMAFGNPNDPRHAALPGSVNRCDWETVLGVIEELDNG